MDPFFEELFDLLGFSDEEGQEYLKTFQEILNMNLVADLAETLPENKRAEFVKLVSADGQQDGLKSWMKDNIQTNADIVKKLGESVTRSYRDFFEALVADLDTGKKDEVEKFAQSYMGQVAE